MEEVNELFDKLFSFNEEDRGVDEIELLNVEKRIGIALPKRIRDFYINQVKNELINSCHNFEKLKNLQFNEDGWLGIYSENQGICYWAIHKRNFNDNNVKIFVNYEGQGFEEEARSFKDFLIIRAATDYSMYIYPFIIIAQVIKEEDIRIIIEKFGDPKSDISVNHYFRKRLFWNDENEIVKITEWDKRFYQGAKNISIVSKNKESILDYQKLIKSENWRVLQDNIKSKENLESYFERKEEVEVLEVNNVNLARDAEDDSLPF